MKNDDIILDLTNPLEPKSSHKLKLSNIKLSPELEKALALFAEGTRLCILYGMILTTPAIEIKKMKLRQIKKELKELDAK